jgi:preprotein translocase subunit SecB
MNESNESKFKVKMPKLKKLEYEFNNSYENFDTIKLKVQTETKILKKINSAIVSLKLKVFDKNKYELGEVPFYICINMFSEFEWDDSIEEKTVTSLLEGNAPAVILSYMRPFISSLTTGSGYPPLIVPLLNFKENKVEYIN